MPPPCSADASRAPDDASNTRTYPSGRTTPRPPSGENETPKTGRRRARPTPAARPTTRRTRAHAVRAARRHATVRRAGPLFARRAGRRQPRARRRVEHAHVPVEPHDATRPSGENRAQDLAPPCSADASRARRRVEHARTRPAARRHATVRRGQRPRPRRRRARPTPAAPDDVEHAHVPVLAARRHATASGETRRPRPAAAVLGRRQPRARRRVEHAHAVRPHDATRPSGENGHLTMPPPCSADASRAPDDASNTRVPVLAARRHATAGENETP